MISTGFNIYVLYTGYILLPPNCYTFVSHGNKRTVSLSYLTVISELIALKYYRFINTNIALPNII